MSETNKNIELTNGWILCPSKSLPGKFYYFNVLNGVSVWSLNPTDNMGIKKKGKFHIITDKFHSYPEPTTLPDETTPVPQNITQRTEFLQHISNTPQLPTFGQAIIPKYVANTKPLIPNIVKTSVNPFPMFCPERKPLLDKVIQISFTDFVKSTNIPLSERFKSYEPPLHSFDTKNNIANPCPKCETSTPKNSFQECVPKSQNVFPKSLIKQSAVKLEPKLPTPKSPIVFNSNKKLIISVSSKVERTEVPKAVQEDQVLKNLDSTDLRFLLLAKKKSLETTDAVVERKKTKPLKQKVKFNLNNETDTIMDNNQEDIPLTSNQPRTIYSTELNNDKTIISFIKDTPKTPPPLAKDQPPMFLPTGINQPPTAINQLPTAINQRPAYKNRTWYIVVDTDVLLLDYEMIDKLVLSDPKCRLVIPFAVAADIEALCLGDCRGQQRVINARQLTRRLAAPPPHYIVEPRTADDGNLEVTTEGILRCCMKAVNKNYYVVLITNDPHLQIRATSQNIQSYKLNEIKYGVDIKPTSEPKNIQRNTKNLFKQNLSQFGNLRNPETTSQETTMNSASENDEQEKKRNFGLFNFRSPVKTILFLSSDSETDNSDSKQLMNGTKPICMKNIENDMTRPDSDGTSDISTSSEVSSLKLKKNVLKPQNADRNLFLPQSVPNIQKPNSVFITKTIVNEKVWKPNHDLNEFQKDSLEYNFENTEKVFCSIPIMNFKHYEQKSKPENSVKPYTLRQEPFGANSASKILNPSQTRITKIMNTVNTDSTTKTKLENATQAKDSTGIFKIPKLLPIKNTMRNTSVHAESPTANDKIGTRTNIDPIDENLWRFRIKNKNMRAKIMTRIDEWICCYMQIMEEALVNILEKNSVCMKNTAAPLTLKDTLNCIKMLYDTHQKIRDITNKLSELLEKCMICVQGKSKISVPPEDFMKIFGYGTLLVHVLKLVLPENEELKEAGLRLSAIQFNLESNATEIDPELVKSPSVSRAEADQDQEEIRLPFQKTRSYVVDYLKKHFEKWATYEEHLEDHNIHKIENHTDFKVLRTCGKNLNLLKLGISKTMTLSQNTIENNSATRTKDKPKLIRLLENNQISKPDKIETIETTNNETSTKSMGLANNENSQNDSGLNEILTDKEKDVPLEKRIGNIEQGRNIESQVKELLNYTSHEDSVLEENAEKDEPKINRTIKLIDEFEKKINYKREPLDLDLLDYSEIYEPSINEIVDFDIISEKNKKSEEISNLDVNNFGLTDTVCTMDDFFMTPSVSTESKNTENCTNENNSENVTSYNFNSVLENNNKNAHIQEKTENNSNEVESETYTEIQDSLIGNDNSETHIGNSKTQTNISETPDYDSGTHLDTVCTVDDFFVTPSVSTESKNIENSNNKNNSETIYKFNSVSENIKTNARKNQEKTENKDSLIGNDNSETHIGNSETRNYDSGTHLDNSETRTFEKTAEIVHDCSTNDSGFENDSTYAHSMIKIFLHELSTTFTAIHSFVTNFIEEFHETELSARRKDVLHKQASKTLEDVVAIIQYLKCIIKRESAEDTVLKRLLRHAGVEASADKRVTRYRQIVIKCLEQSLILENALRIIVSTTIGDFEALSMNAEALNTSLRYFNIFE